MHELGAPHPPAPPTPDTLHRRTERRPTHTREHHKTSSHPNERRFCECSCASSSGRPSRRCHTVTRRRVNSKELGDCTSSHAPWQIQEASPIDGHGRAFSLRRSIRFRRHLVCILLQMIKSVLNHTEHCGRHSFAAVQNAITMLILAQV